jgi:biopolymer transport protein ExbD
MTEPFARPEVPTMNRINVTPIIDVALVLVIVLLVTAPMLAVTDTSLELPAAHARVGVADSRIFLTLGHDGRLGVDDEIVPRSHLVSALHERLEEEGPEKAVVIVRADMTVPHATVRDLLEEARDAGAQHLAVATQPEDSR